MFEKHIRFWALFLLLTAIGAGYAQAADLTQGFEDGLGDWGVGAVAGSVSYAVVVSARGRIPATTRSRRGLRTVRWIARAIPPCRWTSPCIGA